jgi:hypothetical protein
MIPVVDQPDRPVVILLRHDDVHAVIGRAVVNNYDSTRLRRLVEQRMKRAQSLQLAMVKVHR